MGSGGRGAVQRAEQVEESFLLLPTHTTESQHGRELGKVGELGQENGGR